MRTSSLLLLAALALAACDRGDEPANHPALAKAEADQRTAAAEDGRILCARGNAALTRTCTVEQTQGPDGLVLTLRQEDGGFHRLRVTRDGRGVIAADGAQPARVTIVGDREIEVAIAGSRYRLPATMKAATGG